MKLDKKKKLAARTLHVGKDRILFNPTRLTDIKEAITKEDIRSLLKDKAIKIKPVTGKRKRKRKRRRREGKIKKKVKRRKKEYIIRIRKLRSYLKKLKESNEINKESYHKLRRLAKSGMFHSLKHLKEHVASIKKKEILKYGISEAEIEKKIETKAEIKKAKSKGKKKTKS
jgi:large subunit ribosomal protein L19e